MVAACVLALVPQAGWGVSVSADLSPWSVVQYQLNLQSDAVWVVNIDNAVAAQRINADPSFLLSDFNIAGTALDGSWRVETTGDDDFVGFVFGYQDKGRFYLFDWKQDSQDIPEYGFAEQGMSIKLVDTGGADMTAPDFWQTAGTESVTVLRHNTIAWADLTDYHFHLSFFPDIFQVQVRQGTTLLESWTVSDSTYTDGKFGFYNFSQGSVRYEGFTREDDPPAIEGHSPDSQEDSAAVIPEPMTVIAALLSLGGVGAYLRRRMAA